MHNTLLWLTTLYSALQYFRGENLILIVPVTQRNGDGVKEPKKLLETVGVCITLIG